MKKPRSFRRREENYKISDVICSFYFTNNSKLTGIIQLKLCSLSTCIAQRSRFMVFSFSSVASA